MVLRCGHRPGCHAGRMTAPHHSSRLACADVPPSVSRSGCAAALRPARRCRPRCGAGQCGKAESSHPDGGFHPGHEDLLKVHRITVGVQSGIALSSTLPCGRGGFGLAMRGRRAGYGTVGMAATRRAVYWCKNDRNLTSGMKLTALGGAKGAGREAEGTRGT